MLKVVGKVVAIGNSTGGLERAQPVTILLNVSLLMMLPALKRQQKYTVATNIYQSVARSLENYISIMVAGIDIIQEDSLTCSKVDFVWLIGITISSTQMQFSLLEPQY